jgi:hypothetical protein
MGNWSRLGQPRKGRFYQSQYVGVSHNGKRWQAFTQFEESRKHLGTYDTEIEAAQVRDRFILKHNLPNKLNF